MSLKQYFEELRQKVENSDTITNAGKDDSGFYKPKRTILLRHLNLLIDLHDKPRARELVKKSWETVQEQVPFEWLILNETDKAQLMQILTNSP